MSYSDIKAISGIASQVGTERLEEPRTDSLEKEKGRLRKATKEFESLFMYEMLKTMRKTIPQDSQSKRVPFSNGLGKDTFTQIFDMELAKKMSSGEAGSIGAMLYNSLEKVIEAQHRSDPSEIKNEPSVRQPRKPIELKKSRENIPLPHFPSIPIHHNKTDRFMSVDPFSDKRSEDRILRRFGQYIDEAARENSLDSALIYAVIKAESNGDPHAVSTAGAKGLMQLVDSTVKSYRVSNVFDPSENIHAGSKYLRHLLDRFGDLRMALAAYNAGPRNVERHSGMPPFQETKDYVDKVIDIFTELRRPPPACEAKVPATNIR